MSEENEFDEIGEFFISLFVEKKELFSNMIQEINKGFNDAKIKFQYDYDGFCKDYLRLLKQFFKNHPDVDYKDLNMIYFYTNIIIGEIFLDKKINYKDDRSENNQ